MARVSSITVAVSLLHHLCRVQGVWKAIWDIDSCMADWARSSGHIFFINPSVPFVSCCVGVLIVATMLSTTHISADNHFKLGTIFDLDPSNQLAWARQPAVIIYHGSSAWLVWWLISLLLCTTTCIDSVIRQKIGSNSIWMPLVNGA